MEGLSGSSVVIRPRLACFLFPNTYMRVKTAVISHRVTLCVHASPEREIEITSAVRVLSGQPAAFVSSRRRVE